MRKLSGWEREAQRAHPLRLFRIWVQSSSGRGSTSTSRSGWPWALLVLALLAALLFRGVLFGGEVFFSRDIAPFFRPMKTFLARSVRHGVLPLWNPWILNGEPFFATLQPGVLYPGNVLLYLLPIRFSFDLTLVLHFVLAGGGTFLLLRRWDRSRLGALFGSVAFMLGGYLVSVGGYPNNLQTVAWLPWVWVAWDRLLADRSVRTALLFSLACAVAFLGGEPQMLALGLGLMFLHGLLRIERREARLGAAVVAFAASGILALALAAVQLLPLIELVRHSVRMQPTGLDFATRWATEPVNLSQFLVPPALGSGPMRFGIDLLPAAQATWILTLYPGVVVLCMAGVGIVRHGDRRWTAFWAVTAVVGVLMALGPSTPVFPLLYHVLPPLKAVRYPEKFLWLTALAISVVSARGLDGVLDGRGRLAGTLIAAAMSSVLLAASLLLLVRPEVVEHACRGALQGARLCGTPGEAARTYGKILLRGGVLAAAAGILLGVCEVRRIRPALAGAGLLALAAADLLVAQDHVNPSVNASLYEHPPWAVTTLRSLDPDVAGYRYRGSPTAALMGSAARVLRARELSNMYLEYETAAPNTGMLAGIQTQDGLQGLELTSEAELETTLVRNSPRYRTKMLRAMNVHYYADASATADSMPGLTPVAGHSELPIRIFRVDDPLPRAYFATSDTVVREPVQAFGASVEPGFPLASRVAVWPRPDPRPKPTSEGRVTHATYGVNKVRLEVQADGPGLVVLTDRFYPGWHATVDGSPRPVLRANGFFRAVAVPEGGHEIEFEFAPASVRIGAWISLAGLLVWTGLWIVPFRGTGRA